MERMAFSEKLAIYPLPVWKEDAIVPFNYEVGVIEEIGLKNLPGKAC